MVTTKIGKFARVVIYQYGKVGSATILTNICKWLNARYPGTTTKIQLTYPIVVHIHDPKIMADILKKYKNVLIINATRNFHDRQISEFFQQSKNVDIIKEADLSKIGEALLENSIYRLNNWYSKFEDLLGFTLEQFDYSKYFSLTKTRNVSVLIVRLEDSKKWSKIFQQHIHPKIDMSKKTNISSKSWYGDTYTNFKSSFSYPDEVILKLNESDTHSRYYRDFQKFLNSS